MLRVATHEDIEAIAALIEDSGRRLSVGFYTPEQIDAIVQHVFGVDTQLIDDRTYFVIESEGALVACGGWSKRQTLFGGDKLKTRSDPLLDPENDAGRIRAFFVHPSASRRGLGARLMEACIASASAHGFGSLELVSTLPGEPFYRAAGFTGIERFDLELPGVRVPVVRMSRAIGATA